MAATKETRFAADVMVVQDEGDNVVLIFDTPELFAEYEESERTGGDFDLSRLRTQAMELRDKIDVFLDDLALIGAAS